MTALPLAGAVSAHQPLSVPWSAWFADEEHTLLVPAGWSVDWLEPPFGPVWTQSQIAAAIRAPFSAPPLRELAQGARRVCIAVDDLARPTRAGLILPHVLQELCAGGLKDDAVDLVIATGAHSNLQMLEAKIGPEAAARLRVHVHDQQAVATAAIEYGGRPLLINRTFLDADLKIGIGAVLPHPFAGYSGGAKLLVPGLADLAACDRSHKFVRMGLRGGTGTSQNGFRLEIERIARRVGYSFTICCVPDARREMIGVCAGDVVAAHRQASLIAARAYATPVASNYDCLIVNAYPKDTDLIQAQGALVALKTATRPVVNEGGLVVLAAAASGGLGSHGLFGPGGLSYRPPSPRRDLANRELWLYTPAISPSDARKLFWEGYRFFQCAEELSAALHQRLGPAARAAILPCGPLQQIVTS